MGSMLPYIPYMDPMGIDAYCWFTSALHGLELWIIMVQHSWWTPALQESFTDSEYTSCIYAHMI